MCLSVHEDGNVQIDLEPDDEPITITIGPAEVVCFRATIANPGTGPLVQVVLTDQTAQAVVDSHPFSLEVQFSPLEEGQSKPRLALATQGSPAPMVPRYPLAVRPREVNTTQG